MSGANQPRWRRPATASSGLFIALVGPDGVGKTTLATRLIDGWGGPTAYIHFLPSAFSAPPPAPATAGPSPPKAPRSGSILLGLLRLGRNWLRFWMGYLIQVAPRVRNGHLVLADRWGFGYVGQPYALRFYGPNWVARLAVRLLPRPDLIVNMVAPAAVIAARKADLTTAEIEQELALWRRIPGPVIHVDANRAPSDIAAEIVSGSTFASRCPE